MRVTGRAMSEYNFYVSGRDGNLRAASNVRPNIVYDGGEGDLSGE